MATIDRPTSPAPASTSNGRSAATPPPPVQAPKPRSFLARSWLGILVVLALLVAHYFGWQATGIDPGKLVNSFPTINRLLGEVLSPDIITHDEARIEQDVPVAGATTPTGAQPAQAGGIVVPSLYVGTQPKTDTPADLGSFNANVTVSAGTVAPGQTVTVTGTGFRPSTGGQVLWKNAGESASVETLGAFTSDAQGNINTQVQVPADADRVINTSGFASTLAVSQSWDYGSPYLSEAFNLSKDRILETIALALMATTFSIIIGLPLSFLASRNLMMHNPVSTGVYYVTRMFLNILRSIEVIIWAVIFAAAVGLGPFAGMLALTLHSVASLGKLYSEAIEAIDPGPMEALTATGANRLQVIVYAVIPQFIPQFLSFTMYRFDINVRMSTIVGLVGGGGIGFILLQYINLTQWNQAGTALLMIAIVVILMDYLSSLVRKAAI